MRSISVLAVFTQTIFVNSATLTSNKLMLTSIQYEFIDFRNTVSFTLVCSCSSLRLKILILDDVFLKFRVTQMRKKWHVDHGKQRYYTYIY